MLMSTIKNKYDNDFYSLLDTLSISELEEFIGTTEETGLAETLPLNFFDEIIESTKDFVDTPTIYTRHITPVVQQWTHTKPILRRK